MIYLDKDNFENEIQFYSNEDELAKRKIKNDENLKKY